MKLSFIFLLTFLQIVFALDDWDSFKKKYEKVYESPEEENFREKVFLQNLKLLEEQNRKFEEGRSSFSVKVPKHADRTKEELGFLKPGMGQYKVATPKTSPLRFSSRQNIPESIDWRDYGVVTPVADQLYCNSCWAFAVVGTVEAHNGIYHQNNVSLSQQNLVDCVDPNFTCPQSMDREILEKTYQYIVDNNGIDTAESYPYLLYSVENCSFTSENVGATIKSYVNITEGDEEEMKAVVGTIGPVTVAITTSFYWDAYRDGVFYEEDCMNTTEIFNHAVVVVGYGSEDGQDYWLVKNSWGIWFGQEGYIKMARNRDNNCGIASIARYPVM